MYRYDEFDAEFVRQRVAQFRDQVGRRAVGRADRGRVQAAAADERRLPAAARLHAAHRHPLRHAVLAPDAQARPHRAHLRPRHRPLHHAPEPAVQLAQALRHPRHPGRAGRGRDARHPDLRQLHPQRHRRPFRRRRRRRGRRPAPLRRDHPPVVVAAPRVQLPAAQVQGRGDGRRARPRRHPGARHRPAPEAPRRRRPRLCRLRRRRPGPHADHRQDDPRRPARGRPAELPGGRPARLQSAGPARQQVQGAHQDPGARDRRRGLHARRSRRSGSASATAR